MHMSDALISPVVGGTITAITVGANAYCIKKLKEDSSNQSIVPLMGVMGAFVFAAQMINIAIPGTGSSGHIMGDLLLCTIIGPYATYITMSAILLIQALFFADGGIIAYGANVFNMAFFTCFIVYPFIYKPIINKKKGAFFKKLLIACLLSKIIGEELGALAVVLETMLSFKITMPFKTFLISMESIHLLIGILEGIITYAILAYLYKQKPEIIYENYENNEVKASPKTTMKKLIPIAIIAILLSGAFSIFASSKPDGLEWSLFKEIPEEEIEADTPSVFGDYEVGPEELSGNAKTSLAGIVGTTVTLVATLGIGTLIIRKKKKDNDENIS